MADYLFDLMAALNAPLTDLGSGTSVPGRAYARTASAGYWRMLWSLVPQLSRRAHMTVPIHDALNFWNGAFSP